MPPGYRLFQPYSEDSDDDSVPWWKGTPGFPGGSPLCEFFSLAHHTCKLSCTKVEEAVLIAAAIQGMLIGDVGCDSSQGPAPAIGTNRRELMLYQFVLI